MKIEDKTEMVSLDQIVPYKNNAKLHPEEQINKLKRSIKRFGFNVPIILNKDNILVAGHGRYLAAKELEMDFLPAIYKNDLTDDEVKAYRLFDNKIAEGQNNVELLKQELDELKELNFDITLTGYDDLLPEFESVDDAIGFDVDEDTTKQAFDTYMAGNTKQIVLYYPVDEYRRMMEKLDVIKETKDLDTNANAVYFLLQAYEENHQ